MHYECSQTRTKKFFESFCVLWPKNVLVVRVRARVEMRARSLDFQVRTANHEKCCWCSQLDFSIYIFSWLACGLRLMQMTAEWKDESEKCENFETFTQFNFWRRVCVYSASIPRKCLRVLFMTWKITYKLVNLLDRMQLLLWGGVVERKLISKTQNCQITNTHASVWRLRFCCVQKQLKWSKAERFESKSVKIWVSEICFS